jgi:phospholipid/cholesterol/gamma-HCH transport system substrate-binding protein
MKISNETKVGALSAIAIVLLILGFNFLKGKNLFSNSHKIYAKYSQVDGLAQSNAVMINGLQVGTVYDIKPMDNSIDTILVTLNFSRDVNIPNNSVAVIKTPPLGTPEVDIIKGNGTTPIQLGDTIRTIVAPGLLDGVMKSVDPLVTQATAVLAMVDSVLLKFSDILDPNTKGNLRSTIANLNALTASLARSSASLDHMLDKENGSVTQAMDHLNSFTDNLAKNNGTLTATLENLKKTSDGLAQANISHAVNELDSSSVALHQLLTTTKGSVGALLNEKTLYNNLNSTVRSLNILLDDLKTHPKRYVSISVFGKKDKSAPLTAPLSEDSAKNYIQQH